MVISSTEKESGVGAMAQSESVLPIQPLCDGSVREGFAADAGPGAPGACPYARGVHPAMTAGRPWTMRQYAGFGTAQEPHERHHGLVGAGTLRTARDVRGGHVPHDTF
ncbi:hypothetical protein C3486_05500 [Streptomyces sp. Ru73]|uniref:methylmalonyl-CoA mutase family protein n=1 Tax=Streptomyces sp. Ru73 TaxID=2080748 RepID=UPI000CDD6988|nr:methylmalonyl-CoA mutase family protein [Streptomyces sp. Ru73]POX42458.1 hypothetical protein C3486_05500 [Streptomyces sp. Ru73]